MSKTNFERNRILGRSYGGAAYSVPATLYLGLFTAAPSVTGGGTEVAGGSYARLAITNDGANWSAPVAGVVSNLLALVFAAATASWGTVTHVGIFDALAGGNLLDFTALAAAKTINSGDVFSFSIGAIQLTET